MPEAGKKIAEDILRDYPAIKVNCLAKKILERLGPDRELSDHFRGRELMQLLDSEAYYSERYAYDRLRIFEELKRVQAELRQDPFSLNGKKGVTRDEVMTRIDKIQTVSGWSQSRTATALGISVSGITHWRETEGIRVTTWQFLSDLSELHCLAEEGSLDEMNALLVIAEERKREKKLERVSSNNSKELSLVRRLFALNPQVSWDSIARRLCELGFGGMRVEGRDIKPLVEGTGYLGETYSHLRVAIVPYLERILEELKNDKHALVDRAPYPTDQFRKEVEFIYADPAWSQRRLAIEMEIDESKLSRMRSGGFDYLTKEQEATLQRIYQGLFSRIDGVHIGVWTQIRDSLLNGMGERRFWIDLDGRVLPVEISPTVTEDFPVTAFKKRRSVTILKEGRISAPQRPKLDFALKAIRNISRSVGDSIAVVLQSMGPNLDNFSHFEGSSVIWDPENATLSSSRSNDSISVDWVLSLSDSDTLLPQS